MSFLGRSIRNRYPIWSTARRDDSSVAGRVLDTIGESMEDIRISGLRMREQMKPMEGKPIFEPSNLWSFNLGESDTYVRYTQDNKDYINIKVSAVSEGTPLVMRQAGSYEELCLTYPTRTEVALEEFRESFTLAELAKEETSIDDSWDFKNKIYKVYFDVKNSDYYYDTRTKEKFNYNYFITIRGVNIADFPIEEVISIKDDGFYETKNYFKEIKALKKEPKYNIRGGKAIEREGFNGEIKIAIKPYNILAKEYMYSLFIERTDRINDGNSLIENRGFFELRKDEDLSYLDYIYRYYDTGDKYRVADIESPDAFQDVLFSQVLLDSSGNNIEVVDYCFDTVRNKLVTIDNSGEVRFYKIGKTHFNPFQIPRTKLIDFSLEAANQQVALYETSKIYALLERPKGTVVNFCVLRETQGIYSFLQDDKSWGADLYLFKGRDRFDRFENADSFEFENYFDSIGQVNFYIVSFINETTTKLLESISNGDISITSDFISRIIAYTSNADQRDIYINSYAMMCEYSLPEYSFNVGFSGNNFGLFFEGVENNLYVIKFTQTQEELYKIKEYKDYFLFDYESGEGATLEKYDSLSISINNDAIVEEVTYD